MLKGINNAGEKSGFCTFAQAQDAKTFIIETDSKDVFNRGVPVNARFADGKKGCKLYFGGLPASFTEERLESMVTPYGVVLSTKVLPRGAGKTCGFVVMAHEEDAQNCMNGLACDEFDISFAKSNDKLHGQKPNKKRRRHNNNDNIVDNNNVVGQQDAWAAPIQGYAQAAPSPMVYDEYGVAIQQFTPMSEMSFGSPL